MCRYIIINKKPSRKVIETLTDNILDDRVYNPDGSGIYFYNGKLDKVSVYKFYPNEEDDVVEKVLQKCFDKWTPGSLLIEHNRQATSGEKSHSQTHPIPIVHVDDYGRNMFEGWYIIHNGILPSFEIEGIGNLSDTQLAARVLGQWMYDHNIKEPLDFANERWAKFWESNFVGSKVTIVYKNLYYTINSNLGDMENGFWVSSKYSSVKNTTVYKYGNYNTAWEYDDYNYYANKGADVIPDFDPDKKEVK